MGSSSYQHDQKEFCGKPCTLRKTLRKIIQTILRGKYEQSLFTTARDRSDDISKVVSELQSTLDNIFNNLSFAKGDKRYLRLCADGRQEKELYHLHLFYEEYSRSISFRECCLEADVS